MATEHYCYYLSCDVHVCTPSSGIICHWEPYLGHFSLDVLLAATKHAFSSFVHLHSSPFSPQPLSPDPVGLWTWLTWLWLLGSWVRCKWSRRRRLLHSSHSWSITNPARVRRGRLGGDVCWQQDHLMLNVLCCLQVEMPVFCAKSGPSTASHWNTTRCPRWHSPPATCQVMYLRIATFGNRWVLKTYFHWQFSTTCLHRSEPLVGLLIFLFSDLNGGGRSLKNIE